MATFPTLYRRDTTVHHPAAESLEAGTAHDPAIRSESDGGYVISRARFTRIVQNWPNIRYEWLSLANKNTLRTFETDTAVGGSASFDWTHPLSSTVYDVRFMGRIRYTTHQHTNGLFWTVEFGLEEV